MKQCMVAGTQEYPGLPFNKLQELKHIVFERFPQYWKTPFEFEDVWKVCFDILGQLSMQEASSAIFQSTFMHVSTSYFNYLCSMLFQVHCIYFKVYTFQSTM